MKLVVGPSGARQAFKCVVAAVVANAGDFDVVSGNDASRDVTLVTDDPLVGSLYGGNTIVRYLCGSAAAQPAKKKKKSAALPLPDLAADEWLEFEALQLAPAVQDALDGPTSPATPAAAAAAAAGGGGAAASSLTAALAHLEAAAAAGAPGLAFEAPKTADKLSPADVAVSATLMGVPGLPAPVQAYVDGVTALEAFQTARARMGACRAAAQEAATTPGGPVTALNAAAPVQKELARYMAQGVYAVAPALKEEKGFEVVIMTTNLGKGREGYNCNAAVQCYGILRRSKSLPPGVKAPKDIAEAMVAALPASPDIDRVEVDARGFMTPYLSEAFLLRMLRSWLAAGAVPPPPEAKESVCVDYSSPNIAKEMHVGHLRSTIIGDSICRILEYMGHTVERINHVGDWGTQFGMLIAHLKDTCPNFETETPDIADLTKFYKAAKVRFDKEEGFKQRAHDEVVALQAGDETNLRLWRLICSVSETMFTAVYERLGVSDQLLVRGESFYNDKLADVVGELERKGLIEDDAGARVMRIEGQRVPLMVVKTDGGFCYDSTDLAAARHRIVTDGHTRLVYVIDAGQELHMQLVIAGAYKAGWAQKGVHRLEHVGFGVVQGEDGKKFKTRSGDSVRLVDLLDKAVEKATDSLRKRVAAGNSPLEGEEEVVEVGRALGYGGVKYFDLRQNRNTNYIFSYDRMLAHDGDTAVYMQYAHARVNSVKRRVAEAGHDVDALLAEGAANMRLAHPSELELANRLARWADALHLASRDLRPDNVCGFMWNLCNAFSGFYRDCRVLNDPQMASRLALAEAVLLALRQGMELVGISPVRRI